MYEMKATLLDDDAFKLLAIPFGGPIPNPKSPIGVDLDGEWFDEDTDITVDGVMPKSVPVDWHHGMDTHMKAERFGKAVDPEMDEDGWWVKVWLDHGKRRLNLIKQLAEQGATLYGSSQAHGPAVRKAATGHIEVWPYIAQALSTSPQNTLSVARPLKAVLAQPLHDRMRKLHTDLQATLETGESEAKARLAADELLKNTERAYRVLSNRKQNTNV